MQNLTQHQIYDFDKFIEICINISNNYKTPSVIPDFIMKKNENDLFTNVVNEVFVTSANLLNTFMESVIKNFGDYDSYNLLQNDKNHYHNNDLKYKFNGIHNNMVDFLYNGESIDGKEQNNKYFDGYFIFKGGNIFKYHTMIKFLKLYDFLDEKNINLQTILNNKINDVFDKDRIINTYSDFDFTYYLHEQSNNDYDEDIYKTLVGETLYNIYNLRNTLEEYFKDTNIIKKINDISKNIKLYSNILQYLDDQTKIKNNNGSTPVKLINNDRKNINFNLDIQIRKYIHNTILFKIVNDHINNNILHITDIVPRINNDNIIDTHIIFEKDDDKSIKISFNNTILTKTTDFDLYRLKLGFSANNNYASDNFASELYDLSIIRPQDHTTSNHFHKHANIYSEIITLKYKKNNIQNEYKLRIITSQYVLQDILDILFIPNIFLWNNVKYDKRIARLGFLYSSYIDEINDHNFKMICFYIIIFIIFLQGQFNKNRYLFEQNNINKIELFVNRIYNVAIQSLTGLLNFNRESHENIEYVLDIIRYYIDKIIVNFNYDINFIDNLTELVSEPYPNNKMRQNINIKRFNGQYQYVEFLLVIVLTFIKKIYIDGDIDWCTKKYYQNINFNDVDITTYHIDMLNFKQEMSKFLLLFSKHFLLGVNSQTQMIQLYMKNFVDNFNEIYNIKLNSNLVGGKINRSNILTTNPEDNVTTEKYNKEHLNENVTIEKPSEKYNKMEQLFIKIVKNSDLNFKKTIDKSNFELVSNCLIDMALFFKVSSMYIKLYEFDDNVGHYKINGSRFKYNCIDGDDPNYMFFENENYWNITENFLNKIKLIKSYQNKVLGL